MSWTTITIHIPEELKDAIVGEFSTDGILGVWERPLAGGGSVELVLYFAPESVPPLVGARAGRVFERNGHPAPIVTLGTQEEEDWTLEWRKGYTSFPVGERFQVVPSWEEAGASALGRFILRIDPGLAFGTGTHETTQLMLEALEQSAPDTGPVFDLGTGSGILTIAAHRMGFRVEAACDIDSDAVRVAAENLVRNDVNVPAFVGSLDAVRAESVALLLANLTSEVIVNLFGEMVRVLTPGGRAVLSGILESQSASVQNTAQAEGLRVERTDRRGEWVAMSVATDGG